MKTEFEKFDAVMKKVMSVSHDELKRRARAWKRKRVRKKASRKIAAKTSGS